MKRNFAKLLLALVAGLALSGCAEVDVEGRGRGRVGLPPVIVPGPTVYEPRHAEDRDDEGEKHKHKHKKKDKDKDEGDDDDDDDGDRRHGKHKKD